MAYIGDLKQVQWLSLYGTQVTDAGLTQLSDLTQLRTLSLYKTHVTDAGVTALRKALPNCQIVR